VREEVEAGHYGSEGEVLEDGLKLLKGRLEEYSAKQEELRSALDAGIEQLDNGEGKPFDKDRIARLAKERQTEV